MAVLAAVTTLLGPCSEVLAQMPFTALSELAQTWGGAPRPFGPFRCVSAYDYDGDQRDDLLFAGDAGRLRLFRNLGQWRFEDRSDLLPALPASYAVGGVVWSDLDQDGRADLVIAGRNGPTRLLQQQADGSFEELSESSGLSGEERCFSLNLADFDGDGLIDLYLARINAANQLFRNTGNLIFVEEALDRGADDPSISMGALATDFDADGDTDLYLTHDGLRPNLYLVNDGQGRFLDQAPALGLDLASNGMGVAAADLNADGRPDLYVTNLYENALLIDTAVGTAGRQGGFLEVAVARGADDRGMGWGVSDGRLRSGNDRRRAIARQTGAKR